MLSVFAKKNSPLSTGSSTSLAPVVPDWPQKLDAALTDDDALMSLLAENPPIEIKLSAVQALRSEEALRLAEREFRTHDRRVHTVAKQCYERSVTQRKMRARADEIIAEATAVSGELMIPANRLVELDQAWRELDTALLHPDQRSKFEELQDALVKHVRELGERQRDISRWCIEGRQTFTAISDSRSALSDATLTPQALIDALAPAINEAKTRLDEIGKLLPVVGPDARNASMLAGQLSVAVSDSARIEAKLRLIAECGTGKPASIEARWHEFDEISDPLVVEALDHRLDAVMQFGDQARREASAAKRQKNEEKRDAAHQQQMVALAELISNTNTALAEGRVTDAIKQLPVLQSAMDRGNATSELQKQLAALLSELLVLKQWQHWSGGQVRAELVDEAEALAKSVVAAEQSKSSKTPVAQLEKYIDQLRARWKELDRLGGATGKPIWQRFDSALKAAEAPITAHKARIAEARQANLVQREALLAQLDAVSVASDDPTSKPDWKANAAALAHFQSEWRKLGPLEHTVPHKKLPALNKRMQASVARIDGPLRKLVDAAIVEREALVARATTLVEQANDRDLMNKLRALQTQWQTHAKSIPLPHQVERKLWAAFKSATDAVMDKRHAATNARDAEFKAAQTARDALIVRLREIGPDTPEAEIKRSVTEINGLWRECGDAGKEKSSKLEARFRDALDTVRQHLAGSAQRKWQASCSAALAKLVICRDVENSSQTNGGDSESFDARWAAQQSVTSPWDTELQARYGASLAAYKGDSTGSPSPSTARTAAKAKDESLDDLLLKLELALGIASPASAESARRALKLLAMKNALEGRKSSAPEPADISKLSREAFAWRGTTVDQQSRLEAVLAAVQQAGPDCLKK
jgi:DNA repair protein SbcC/Rad50